MKTVFCLRHRDFSALAINERDATRDEPFETPLDWNLYRAALVYAAVLYAMRKMKNAKKADPAGEQYLQVAKAFAGMLHRIGDLVDDPELGEPRERQLDLNSAEAHDLFVRDLKHWALTGEARYRVSAWAPQWEPLSLACHNLEETGHSDDTDLFHAAFQMEFLSNSKQRVPADVLHDSLIALCARAQSEFDTYEDMHFLVRPLMSLEAFLKSANEAYHLQYVLKETE
jgi:hypothetical protein